MGVKEVIESTQVERPERHPADALRHFTVESEQDRSGPFVGALAQEKGDALIAETA
jgi:hypothetical protein